MLKPLKPNSFWSLPSHSFLSSPLPSASLFPPLFSRLNCKYQVPFILFCYFCYYCYYIVVLVIFFFFSSRPAQQCRDCLSSVAVCKYISVPGSGGEKQNKMFHFYSLSLHFSLHDFPFSPINVVITVLFIVLCFLGGVGGTFPPGW